MLALWPFGSQVTDNGNSGGCLSVIMNVIWIASAVLDLPDTSFLGLLLCITLIGIPFGRQHFKWLRWRLLRLGKVSVDCYLFDRDGLGLKRERLVGEFGG